MAGKTFELIRNFVIIAHIDSGKSTLADRLLELTGTVEARSMKPQYLDQLELERERGITIKMAPVRMLYHSDRGLTQTDTRTNADTPLLYESLTYQIRGCVFAVKKLLGLSHKEVIYQKALEEEFGKANVSFEREKAIDLFYEDKKIGIYRPDFIVDDKVILEIKSIPFIGQTEEKQLWSYLKGSPYKLALLVNFGGKDVDFKRVVYETARLPRESASSPRQSADSEYILNLIDTPGHSDFSYEVSRALAAVEGAVLLVDAAKGIQAQTLSNFRAAKRAGLTILGAVNKVDLKLPNLEKIVGSLADLLEVAPEEIFRISAKTGEGVRELLEAVIEKVPAPRNIGEHPRSNQRLSAPSASRALIFDSLYDDHKGIIAFVRVFGGEFRGGDELRFLSSGARSRAKEVGQFAPALKAVQALPEGSIGYIATGLKEPALVKIGDTVAPAGARAAPLPGYREPTPVVFISFYPDGRTKFGDLEEGLERLRLNDAALAFEPDANDALGRGLKVGFLGQLHFDITASRLKREFNLEFLTSFPSIAYRVIAGRQSQTYAECTRTNAEESQRESASSPRQSAIIVKQPQDFPDKPDQVFQPMIRVEILTPSPYLNYVVNLKKVFDLEILDIKNLGENLLLTGAMPLAELIRDFDDQLKSVSSGFASFSYELSGEARAEVDKFEILVAGDVVPALTRIVPSKDLDREARSTVERLKRLLPAQQFAQAIQGRARGRIIARETIPALKKDVTGYLYGGDRTRKMKLWRKQKRGKEKLKEMGRVDIMPEVFREILKK